MVADSNAEGYSLQLAGGKLQANFIKRWLDDALRVETEEPLALDRWQHVAVAYDGSRVASGVRIYVDGQPQKIKVLLDELNQSFVSAEPLRIGGGGNGPRFAGLIDDVRIYTSELDAEDDLVAGHARPGRHDRCAGAASPHGPTGSQAASGLSRTARSRADSPLAAADRGFAAGRNRSSKQSFPTTMVMEEMPAPRPTFVLVRGQYDKPGDRVDAGRAVRAQPSRASASARSPGAGPLAGRSGQPAHRARGRESLLAVVFRHGPGARRSTISAPRAMPPAMPICSIGWPREFIAGGWNMKRIQRLIVTSTTYRQSSTARPSNFWNATRTIAC